MKLAALDRNPACPGVAPGPIAHCLQWLDTLTNCPAVKWHPGQLAAVRAALHDARELLATDLLPLAQRAWAPQADPRDDFALLPAALERRGRQS